MPKTHKVLTTLADLCMMPPSMTTGSNFCNSFPVSIRHIGKPSVFQPSFRSTTKSPFCNTIYFEVYKLGDVSDHQLAHRNILKLAFYSKDNIFQQVVDWCSFWCWTCLDTVGSSLTHGAKEWRVWPWGLSCKPVTQQLNNIAIYRTAEFWGSGCFSAISGDFVTASLQCLVCLISINHSGKSGFIQLSFKEASVFVLLAFILSNVVELILGLTFYIYDSAKNVQEQFETGRPIST